MPEWWTYTLSDFLMFSPRTYYRLVERYNVAIWPGQVLALALGLGILWLLRRPAPGTGRVIAGILALLWAWVACAFLWMRYATIDWPVSWLAAGFGVEVVLLVWFGVIGGRLGFRLRTDAAGIVGLLLFVLSLALYPSVAPLLGRSWQHAEVFGAAPDPTVLGTLGLLLLVEGRPRWQLMVVPLAWCGFSGATLWAMGSPEAWLVLSAGLLVVIAAARTRFRPPATADTPGWTGPGDRPGSTVHPS